MLIRAHIDSFFDPDRPNITTGKIVSEIYGENELKEPSERSACDPEIVRTAATRRVSKYLFALESISATGRMTRDEPLRASIVEGRYVLKSCGYNDIAAWAAAGHETVQDVLIEADKEITVCCCWDGSDYYSYEYINILFRSVGRHTNIPFDFAVFVGPEALKPGHLHALDSAIKVVSVGLPYWWSGMCAWQKQPPGTETENILYLDLDMVILGSLNEIIRYPHPHAYMKDYPAYCCPEGKEGDGNASCTLIRRGAGQKVWAEYVRLEKPQWNPLDPPANRQLPLAVQSIINDPAMGISHAVFPEEWISSYRLWVSKYGLPEGCRAVSFHGLPKPAQCLDLPWVKENWR
ncbi:MAG: hypothetical protein JW950_05655 [Deltaproteobacteria bacterium]|nr:hypothetical protein [Deltaproteobacteria bacterium]